jgi:DNA-directed RNA polymerase specialized sigma24 family protein
LNWQELDSYSLEELIEVLQLQEDDEGKAWADAAFENIVLRFRKDLLEKCTIMCVKNKLTETDAEVITSRVFKKIYQHPTFTRSKCKQKKIEDCFRLYLYKIARNEFADYVLPDEQPYSGTERVITSIVDTTVEYTPEKLNQLQEAERTLDELFSVLTPSHKIIYLTYMYHEKEGKYLPERLRKELRELLHLSQSTIRVYKMQAIELVNSKLKKNGK